MKLTSHDIKAAVASYWRYKRQYSIVAFEWKGCPGGELADVVTVNGYKHLILTEVKVSMSDFRRDKFKWTHRRLREASGVAQPPGIFKLPIDYAEIGNPGIPPRPTYVEAFYFAVPRDLANTVALLCDELYPYAGVLGCAGIHDYNIDVHRKARKFDCVGLGQDKIDALLKAQTATLCRLATKAAEEYRERKRFEGLYRECQKEKQFSTA